MSVLSDSNKKQGIEFSKGHNNGTIAEWKKKSWNGASLFLLQHSDRPEFGVNHMKNMNSSRFISMVRTDTIMIKGLFTWYTIFVEKKIV